MKALYFGKDGFVTLPNIGEVETDKPFTVAAWIYLPKQKEGRVIASQI